MLDTYYLKKGTLDECGIRYPPPKLYQIIGLRRIRYCEFDLLGYPGTFELPHEIKDIIKDNELYKGHYSRKYRWYTSVGEGIVIYRLGIIHRISYLHTSSRVEFIDETIIDRMLTYPIQNMVDYVNKNQRYWDYTKSFEDNFLGDIK